MNESMLPPRPDHYSTEDPTYEPIKVIEAWGLDFSLGNVLKYIARAGRKGDTLEDLNKAMWYLHRAIEHHKNTRASRKHKDLFNTAHNDLIRAYTSCYTAQNDQVPQRPDARDCPGQTL